jgi:hypothetical protein
LLKELSDAGIHQPQVDRAEPTLEDVFLLWQLIIKAINSLLTKISWHGTGVPDRPLGTFFGVQYIYAKQRADHY